MAKRKKDDYGLPLLDWIKVGSIMLVLLLAVFFLGKGVFLSEQQKPALPLPTLKSTLSPSSATAPTSVDLDPLVACNVHINCGGGTRQLKRSICNNSTCCQIGNNWVFYTDKSKCASDQSNSQSNSTQVPVNNSDNSQNTSKFVQECLTTWEKLADICKSGCRTKLVDGTYFCDSNYTTKYGGSDSNPDQYGACLASATAQYSSCLNACTDKYLNDIKNCELK